MDIKQKLDLSPRVARARRGNGSAFRLATREVLEGEGESGVAASLGGATGPVEVAAWASQLSEGKIYFEVVGAVVMQTGVQGSAENFGAFAHAGQTHLGAW